MEQSTPCALPKKARRQDILSVPVQSSARVPHLEHLFYLNRKQARGSSLLFLIETPPFVHRRAMQHAQAVLGNKVHAVPCIWIILCHLMEVFLQQTSNHRLSTLYPPKGARSCYAQAYQQASRHICNWAQPDMAAYQWQQQTTSTSRSCALSSGL